MDLSVVVVSWNTRDLTLRCLDALSASLAELSAARWFAAEIRLVDNGGCDGTAAAVRERFPAVHVIELAGNVGFAAGCNAGLAAAHGRFVLLLNSDAEVPPATLARCVDFLASHPDVGIVGPQLLHADGRRQNSIHRSPTPLAEVVPKALLRLVFPRRHPSWRSVGEGPRDVEAVNGAVLFARHALLAEVGGVPEEYFFFLEETEWCRRCRSAGWRVVHLPEVSATHLSGASSKRRAPALTRIEYHRSLYRFFRTNRGTGWMAMVVAVRFSKALFYVVTQAPLALWGGRGRARWRVHRAVLAWHLRGCPRTVGLAALDAPPPGATPA